jgi:sec-independent protein translocase protein TatA
MPGWIGLPELLILLVVVLVVFGPKRLPEMGRSLGRGMREFKDSVSGNDDGKDDQSVEPLPSGPFAHEVVVTEEPEHEHAVVQRDADATS